MKVICNKCKEEFKAKVRHLKDGKFDVDYLSCPNCQEVSIITVWTDDLKRISEIIKSMRGKKKKRMINLIREESEKIKAEYITLLQVRDQDENNHK